VKGRIGELKHIAWLNCVKSNVSSWSFLHIKLFNMAAFSLVWNSLHDDRSEIWSSFIESRKEHQSRIFDKSLERNVRLRLNNIRGRKIGSISDISRPFDPTSDLVISLAGESALHYRHIFCLPYTFPLLKINVSRKVISSVSVQTFNGAVRNGAFLHSQRPVS
jgi:hypothetical protein